MIEISQFVAPFVYCRLDASLRQWSEQSVDLWAYCQLPTYYGLLQSAFQWKLPDLWVSFHLISFCPISNFDLNATFGLTYKIIACEMPNEEWGKKLLTVLYEIKFQNFFVWLRHIQKCSKVDDEMKWDWNRTHKERSYMWDTVLWITRLSSHRIVSQAFLSYVCVSSNYAGCDRN